MRRAFVKYYRLNRLGSATGVETCCGDPVQFSVSQNYPNPFNPTTTIRYDLPEAADVRLTIFNALGQTIEVVGAGYQVPGTHEIKFNATGLPSGVYLYRLHAGEYVMARRMAVVK